MSDFKSGESKRREPRWDQSEARSVSYVTSIDLGKIPLTILDVSTRGARVSINGVKSLFQSGQYFHGQVVLGDMLALPVNFRVVHVLPSSVGVEFIDTSERFAKALRAFFGSVSLSQRA